MYDINIQRQELYIGVLIANTLKVNLNSQKTTNSLWIVTMIKSILNTPIHRLEQPILSFSITYEAAVRNSKILAAIKI